MNRSEQLRKKIEAKSRYMGGLAIHPDSGTAYFMNCAELRGRDDAFKEVREWLNEMPLRQHDYLQWKALSDRFDERFGK